jgi:hypothetical protein
VAFGPSLASSSPRCPRHVGSTWSREFGSCPSGHFGGMLCPQGPSHAWGRGLCRYLNDLHQPARHGFFAGHNLPGTPPPGRRCAERRRARGWSVKEASKQLKVPQYRLTDIEAGQLRSIEPPILAAYVSHLGLRRWYRRWASLSPEVARLVALKSGADEESRKRKRGRTTR